MAHENFGMVAVDNAHRCMVYPRPASEPEHLDRLSQSYRSVRPDWDDSVLREHAESVRQFMVSLAEFEQAVIQQVHASLENE